jgi:hypothetical protein
MKTIAYFDCPSGISGDMCLGALLDAGVPLDYLHQHLNALGLDDEFTLSAHDIIKRGQRALRANVVLTAEAASRHYPAHSSALTPSYSDPHHHHHPAHSQEHQTTVLAPLDGGNPPVQSPALRNLPEIEQIITQAPLPGRVKAWSLAIFQRLGAAEAAVHGIPVEQVHFHEVGATDAIVDIVGTCVGLDYLKVDTVACSPLPTGQGQVKTAHGWLPVPAPAVLKLMEQSQVPIYSNGLTGELVTPTGAAIVTTLAQQFGHPPAFTLHRVGLGAGFKDLAMANILRLWIGTVGSGVPGPELTQTTKSPAADDQAFPVPGRGPETPSQETISVLETQVDDLIPQAVGYLYDRLFAVGAVDVFTQPVGMKKSRPGLLITVICPPECQTACETVLFTETTTLGIRHSQQQRTALHREFRTAETNYGPVSIKLAYHPITQSLLNAHPEYEDCATLAQRHQVPWQTVYQAALAAWGDDAAGS